MFCFSARGQGFEPRFTASKAAVLPLDDPRIHRKCYNKTLIKSKIANFNTKQKENPTRPKGSVGYMLELKSQIRDFI